MARIRLNQQDFQLTSELYIMSITVDSI